MRILWKNFVLKSFWMLWKTHCQEYFSSFLHIFVWFSCYSSFFPAYFDTDVDSSLRLRSYEDPIWMRTTGNYATGSTTGPKKHEFELCEVKFWSYKWKCSSSCYVFSFRHWVWHFIINDQEMNITGFVLWSSRLIRRFWFNSWYLKGEKNLRKMW